MEIDYYKMNVIVIMVVYVLQVQLVEKFANVLMDLLDHFVNHQFVSFIE
jgi:antibiotic biosynthesis monooxygenase (ABM) superfamily enzyme